MNVSRYNQDEIITYIQTPTSPSHFKKLLEADLGLKAGADKRLCVESEVKVPLLVRIVIIVTIDRKAAESLGNTMLRLCVSGPN